MFKIRKRLLFARRHPFTKDVATLQTASIIGKALSIVTVFVFARVLGPEQYGFYSLVFALASTINIFQEFGIGQGSVNLLALARGENNAAEGKKVLKFFTLMSLIGLGIGAIGVAAAPLIGQKFYDDRYLGILAGVVVATTALTFFLPLATIGLQVARKIRDLAKLETAQRIMNAALPIGLVLLGFGVFGIIAGQFITMILISVVSVGVYWRMARSDIFFPKVRDLLRLPLSGAKFWKYLKFCLQIAVSKDLIKLNSTLPILLVGYFLPTNSALGFYKIAFAYVGLPLMVLDPITRLLNVQFPSTLISGREKLMRRFGQVTLFSLLVALVLVLPAILLAPTLIRLLFPDYEPGIPFIYALAAYPVLVSTGVALGPLFRTLNKMKAAIFIQLITLSLLAPTAYFLIQAYAVKGLIATVLIFTMLPNLLSFFYLFFILKKNESRKDIQ